MLSVLVSNDTIKYTQNEENLGYNYYLKRELTALLTRILKWVAMRHLMPGQQFQNDHK